MKVSGQGAGLKVEEGHRWIAHRVNHQGDGWVFVWVMDGRDFWGFVGTSLIIWECTVSTDVICTFFVLICTSTWSSTKNKIVVYWDLFFLNLYYLYLFVLKKEYSI